MTAREGAFARAALALLAAQIVAVAWLTVGGALGRERANRHHAVNRDLVSSLNLTDLALWSAASYCRHPTVADRFAAFGDHPSAMEHFPAGSLVAPPRAGGPRGEP
jgi:hypothetical protein